MYALDCTVNRGSLILQRMLTTVSYGFVNIYLFDKFNNEKSNNRNRFASGQLSNEMSCSNTY